MILAGILVLCHALIDWYAIEKMNEQINHPVETALFVVAAAIGTMIVINWWFVVLAIGVRLLIFDLTLNILRGRRWDYLGEGAWSDRQLKKLNKWMVLLIRVIVFAVSATIYYK